MGTVVSLMQMTREAFVEELIVELGRAQSRAVRMA
jgi:hypothetical protein